MTHDVISVSPTTPQEEVARLVSKYGFNAMPVVSDEGKALGVVTVDDVVDVLVARETEAALAMGAVAAPSDPDEKHEFDYFGAPLYPRREEPARLAPPPLHRRDADRHAS